LDANTALWGDCYNRKLVESSGIEPENLIKLSYPVLAMIIGFVVALAVHLYNRIGVASILRFLITLRTIAYVAIGHHSIKTLKV